MTDRETPWWAEDDPAGHRSTGPGGNGSGNPDAGPASEGFDRPTWSDVVRLIDVAVRAASQATRRATGSGMPGVATTPPTPGPWEDVDRAHHAGEVCTVCPVCTLLRTLDGSNPDAVAHLLEAARHTTLAVKAVIDAQASRFGVGDDLEHIRVDE